MHVELLTNIVAADDKTLRIKSVTGRFPVLETKEGSRVCENLPIAKYLAAEHPSFYGSNPEQSKFRINQE